MKKKEHNKLFSLLWPLTTARGGFSLFEILFVLTIVPAIIFVISGFSANLNTLQSFLNRKLQSRQDVDQAFQIMTTEIRSAGPSSLGAYPIDSASTSSFTFYSDINKDGLFERVRYFLAATSTIQKGVIKPSGNPLVYATSSEIITTAVSNVVVSTSTILFSYYDFNYTGVEPPMSYPLDISKIRVVKFSVNVSLNASSTPTPEFFSGTVFMRNLKSN